MTATAAPTAAVPRAQAYTYVPGRVISTNFADSAYDALHFTIAGYTYTTDGATPCIKATTPTSSYTTFFSLEKFKDCEILVRFRMQVDATAGNSDYGPILCLRYLNGSYNWSVSASFAVANPVLSTASTFHGSAAHANDLALGSPSDTTDYRYIKVRVIEDAILVKQWIAGANEPDWLTTPRMRANNSGDNTDYGTVGFTSILCSAFISHFQVTELLRADQNILPNSDFHLIDTSVTPNVPLFWQGPSGQASSVTTIADRFGIVRPALQVQVNNAGDTSSFNCVVYNTSCILGPNTFIARNRPHPQALFTPAAELSIWTKGAVVGNTYPLGFVVVIYYYDVAGNVLNAFQPDYVPGLGPYQGHGTWDWYETRTRIHWQNVERLYTINFQILCHDSGATGTLYVMDPVLKPVI